MERENSQLPKLEIFASYFIYLGAVIFALFKAFQFGNGLQPEQFALEDGWSFLNRQRDEIDDEWQTFTECIQRDVFWLMGHVLISELVRFVFPKKVHIAHAVVGIAFVASRLSSPVIAVIIAMNSVHFICMLFGKRYIWLVTVAWLAFINVVKQFIWSDFLLERFSTHAIYEALVIWSWLLLRTTSFALEYNKAKEESWKKSAINDTFSIWKYLGYAFYLPVYQHGPPLIYQRYATMFTQTQRARKDESIERFKHLILALLWIGGIYLLIEFFSHFIYVNVISYNPHIMRRIPSLAMYGFGYGLGQYFCCRYMVSYGLAIALTKFDRIDAPNPPKCIGRIHLYSHMWRYFDQGLHDFLFRYIYCELSTPTSKQWQKLFANFMAFAFIYLWHGYYSFILVWVAANLILLNLEQLQRTIFKTYRNVLKPIGNRNIQRLNAIIGSQLVLPSIAINLMFIGGPDVGQYLIQRTYITGGLLNYSVLSIVAYNFYQYSSFVYAREKRSEAQKEHIN